MNLKSVVISFILILLTSFLSFGSPDDYNFTYFSPEEGMPAVLVYDIDQTLEGRIWFATYSGLYSYDGYRFSNYKAEMSSSTDLQYYNRYTEIESDAYSNLWVLSQSGILFYYNQVEDTFIEIAQDIQSLIKLNSSEFFFVSEGGEIYQSTYSNPRGGVRIIHYMNILDNAQVNDIFYDDAGAVWVLSDCGIYRDRKQVSNSPAFCYEQYGDAIYIGSTDGIVIQYTLEGDIRNIHTGCEDDVYFLRVLDSMADVLIGTTNSRVYKINIGSWTLTQVQGSPYFSDDAINSLRVGSDIYLYSNNGGLYCYDDENNALVPFFDEQIHRAWDSDVNIHSVFSDQQKSLWIASSLGGVEKATRKIEGFNIYRIEEPSDNYASNNVKAQYFDGNDLYVSTRDRKVHIINPKLGKIAEWPTGSVVTSFDKNSNGQLYMSTANGGIIVNEARTKYGYEPKIYRASRQYYAPISDRVLCINAQDSSRVWIATQDESLSYLDVESGEFISKKNRLFFPSEEVNAVRHVTFSPDKRLYACSNLGLFVCSNPYAEPEEIKFERFASVADYTINHIMFTKEGKLYCSSWGGGFLAFESGSSASKVRSYTIEDGLLSDHVYSAIEDEQGIIWIATTGGLNKYNPETGSITPYSREAMGTRATFDYGAPVMLPDGTIYFNSRSGIFNFNPELVTTSKYIPQILIRSCYVAGEERVVTPHTKLRIKSKDSFELTFYAIDQRAPNRIYYYYTIDGLDDEWHLLGQRGNINIDRFKMGRYTLRLKSTNGDGASVNNEFSIEIVSISVFWRSFILVVLLLAVLFIVVMLRRYQYKREHNYQNPEDEKFMSALSAFLDQNIDNAELSAMDVAAEMNISRSALFDKTGNLFGKAPMEILRERRLQKAIELLKDQEYSVSQVAYMCGFSDSHYFSKVFKKHYGQSPSVYRKQYFS